MFVGSSLAFVIMAGNFVMVFYMDAIKRKNQIGKPREPKEPTNYSMSMCTLTKRLRKRKTKIVKSKR